MHRALSSMKVIHFADDLTTLYVNYDRNTDLSHVVNEQLNLISNWLSVNISSIGYTKTIDKRRL